MAQQPWKTAGQFLENSTVFSDTPVVHSTTLSTEPEKSVVPMQAPGVHSGHVLNR